MHDEFPVDKLVAGIKFLLVGIATFAVTMVLISKIPDGPNPLYKHKEDRLQVGDKVNFRIGDYNTNVVVRTDYADPEWQIQTAFVNNDGHLKYCWYPAAVFEKVESDKESLIPVQEQIAIEKLQELRSEFDASQLRISKLELMLKDVVKLPTYNHNSYDPVEAIVDR